MITINSKVPKHIKGMILNYIKQANIQALNDLEIKFHQDNLIIESDIQVVGTYTNEALHTQEYSINQELYITIGS